MCVTSLVGFGKTKCPFSNCRLKISLQKFLSFPKRNWPTLSTTSRVWGRGLQPLGFWQKCKKIDTQAQNPKKGTLLVFNSTKNGSWKKFLHWKLLDIICSSGLKQIHQTKTFTCEFEKFSVVIFPIFEHFPIFNTTNEIMKQIICLNCRSSPLLSIKITYNWPPEVFF